ncbi:PxxKW family cysteine-rich protein [uncultured Pseudodesulfovibrio sp.]|uniref:PxxKW family cysteine-rich protein n=1 Tax=uncultured Pseudodesulfovibrio sp. TaxID=2035858 RepID=UPI0029C82039|nr:PxxKW family cysteine-rich protein [uncultured Pseudodesulfovibrio sp.]
MAKKNVTVSLEGAVKTDAGLTYKGVIMEPVVDQCEGCDRVVTFEDNTYCPTYAQPSIKWSKGVCNFATHARAEVDKTGKVKVNPLKASKRAARGR